MKKVALWVALMVLTKAAMTDAPKVESWENLKVA